jgi:hypothetical protein
LDEFLKWNDWTILAEVGRRADRVNKNLAWRLAERQHPKPVYETGDHADPAVVNRAITALPKELKARYSELKTWLDRASDHPERFRMGDETWPIRHSERWQSLVTLSKALGGLEEIRQFRLYADVRGDERLEQEIERFCREVMS